jgi:hypothetical protein
MYEYVGNVMKMTFRAARFILSDLCATDYVEVIFNNATSWNHSLLTFTGSLDFVGGSGWIKEPHKRRVLADSWKAHG